MSASQVELLTGKYKDVDNWLVRYLFKVDLLEGIVIEPIEVGHQVHYALEHRHADYNNALAKTLLDIIPEYRDAEVQKWYKDIEVMPQVVDKDTGEIKRPAIKSTFTLILDNTEDDETGVDYKSKKSRHLEQEEADDSVQFDIYSWLTGLRKWIIWSIYPGGTELAVRIDTVRDETTDERAKKKIVQAIYTRDMAVKNMLEILNKNREL